VVVQSSERKMAHAGLQAKFRFCVNTNTVATNSPGMKYYPNCLKEKLSSTLTKLCHTGVWDIKQPTL